VEDDDVAGPAGEEIAEVMEDAAAPPVAVGAVATAPTGPSAVVAAADADFGLGQIVEAGDAFGGVGAVFAGSWHGEAPGGKSPTRKYAARWLSVHEPSPISLL
jgi:hypothetical protein